MGDTASTIQTNPHPVKTEVTIPHIHKKKNSFEMRVEPRGIQRQQGAKTWIIDEHIPPARPTATMGKDDLQHIFDTW